MDVAHRPGGAVSLAVGMAHVFSSIGGMSHLMNYWYQFAIMFEALFILTTIDAGTRVARYILQDMLGHYVWPKLGETSWWPGILVTSAFVSVFWGYLLYSGDVASIWPLFGVANQLLSVVALALGTTIILKIGAKKSYAWITAAPLAFLTVTVIWAGILNIQMYVAKGQTMNEIISVVLIILVVITLADSGRKWLELLKIDHPIGMNTEVAPVCQFGERQPTIRT